MAEFSWRDMFDSEEEYQEWLRKGREYIEYGEDVLILGKEAADKYRDEEKGNG